MRPCRTIIDYNSFDQDNYDILNERMKITTIIDFADYFEMNEEQKDLFLKYEFESLIDLDLSGQDIDDDFVKQLCENDNLRKIKSINFSNTNITKKTIKHLLRYDNVSCEGDVRISGKYGKPITEINIDVSGTKITKKDIVYYSEPKFDHAYFGDNIGCFPSVKELIFR